VSIFLLQALVGSGRESIDQLKGLLARQPLEKRGERREERVRMEEKVKEA